MEKVYGTAFRRDLPCVWNCGDEWIISGVYVRIILVGKYF